MDLHPLRTHVAATLRSKKYQFSLSRKAKAFVSSVDNDQFWGGWFAQWAAYEQGYRLIRYATAVHGGTLAAPSTQDVLFLPPAFVLGPETWRRGFTALGVDAGELQ